MGPVSGTAERAGVIAPGQQQFPDLYTLALLAMTFVGFTAIVLILRQSLGSPLSRFDTLVASFFSAWGS